MYDAVLIKMSELWLDTGQRDEGLSEDPKVKICKLRSSLPEFGSILEWRPVLHVLAKRDIVCVGIFAPTVGFEAKNK